MDTEKFLKMLNAFKRDDKLDAFVSDLFISQPIIEDLINRYNDNECTMVDIMNEVVLKYMQHKAWLDICSTFTDERLSDLEDKYSEGIYKGNTLKEAFYLVWNHRVIYNKMNEIHAEFYNPISRMLEKEVGEDLYTKYGCFNLCKVIEDYLEDYFELHVMYAKDIDKMKKEELINYIFKNCELYKLDSDKYRISDYKYYLNQLIKRMPKYKEMIKNMIQKGE